VAALLGVVSAACPDLGEVVALDFLAAHAPFMSSGHLATVLCRVPFLNKDPRKSLFFKMRIKTKYPLDPKATHHLETHTIYQTESPTRGSKYRSYSSMMRHFVYPFDVE